MLGIAKANQIKVSADKLKQALNKIDQRRVEWMVAKTRIINVLNFILKEYDFQWTVQILEELQNLQTVNIKFNSRNSKIVEVKNSSDGKETTKAYFKYGGYLAFMQTYNSQVAVLLKYPHIEEWVDEMESKQLGWYDPEEITNNLILEKVNIFLEEMIKWENHSFTNEDLNEKPYIPIGYKLPERE